MNLKCPLKAITFSLLFFVTSFAGFAEGTFTISGTIQNASATEVKLAVYKTHLTAIAENITSNISNGNYKLTGKLDKPAFATFFYKGGGLKIYLEPGDDLNISFSDDQQHSQMSVSGKGAENNNFYSAITAQFAADVNDSALRQNMMTQSIDAFENNLFMLKKKQNEFLSAYKEKDKLSASFIQYVKNDIDYRYWSLLLANPIIRANSSNKIGTVDQLPALMTEGLSKVPLNNEAALVSESYRAYIYYYVIYFTSQVNGFKKFNDYNTAAGQKLAFAKAKLQGDVFNCWLAQFSLDEQAHVSPFMLKNMVGSLKASDKGLKYFPSVNLACAERMAMKESPTEASLKAGGKTNNSEGLAGADELGLKDINGKPFSLSSLKGKVVYIDFWASWCGPCRVMMPYSKQLHDKLTDKQKKQITFLYISIDADENAWKQGIQNMGVEGTLVISPGNWKSKVCSHFQINSIPRYMIMDKNGNIVDYNAKRPAEPSLFDELVKLTE